ncbi:MAG: gyrase subunit A protein [Parcubacteria group bacterium GW2011_GWA2_50_10]|nr:MAG: gyrase subunit A protein [Parcubacteria group bacterium GW2011_GWA2_50_10]
MANNKVEPREIVEEMRGSYIDYAMSVIVARALPDVRDGLKPVHRRILYAMHEDGLTHGAKYRKSATVIGSTLGRYHPHGDVAVYDALVRMAQDFSMRYPLIDGQGNFGSIDGDPPAAMRYSETRMSRVGEAMLQDIGKDTADFIDNYDGTRKEPVVLPSPLPQLLLNGTLGIAVGMATNIPPHNIREVVDATVYLIDNPKAATVDLFEFIKGPDFPTGGIIYNRKEIIEAYSQGKGPITTRGKAEIAEGDPSTGSGQAKKTQIVITEIPYQVNKASLVEQFAKLVQDKKIDGVRDIRDESDKDGLRVVFDLQRDAHPQKILNRLYKFSDLQKSFHLNMLALVDGLQPKVLSLVEILQYFIDHRRQVVLRRTKYDLERAKEREHILEGLHKCLADIDRVIKIIRGAADREDAKVKLMKGFRLTEIQANAILDTRLAQLARLERQKIEDELKEIREKIKEFSATLASPKKIDSVIKKELAQSQEAFGDERRTKLVVQGVGEIAEEDLVPQEDTIITITQGGYIKRINPSVYKIQKRGGKGIMGMKTNGDDIVEHFLFAKTHDSLLVFTDSGKVFQAPAYEIPEATRVSKGRGLLNFFEMTVRRSGLIAITLKKDDGLQAVRKTTGADEIIIVTKRGQSIRFREKDVRPMGRTASGTHGIRLKKGDEVVGMDAIAKSSNPPAGGSNTKPQDAHVLVVMENGYGKRTALKEYRLQSRGGSGIKTANITSKTGELVSSCVLSGEEEDLIVISRKGHVIRTAISSIPKISRSTQGVRIMKLEAGDKVASAACA